ncbi:Uma2 family endonuclease [Kitasatospora sp. YST-16]|uniref:Uma2 family endonuclease n=1 Tax=Kitasatospora sp. YST-16 TaxID=2998080 RepID=UPI0022853880|nr:Uma2 family endonuclease [Kitasatospora sp. YST-16]WAL72125.1 Uma2 family endonuclease [Kitasatospora sp. YST-16]WNW38167.1 Uma2 family endonuclease [Streptomyces sp. Li-HN-5-13]
MTDEYRALRALADLVPAVPDLRAPEIAEGTVHLALLPGPRHGAAVELVRRQLAAQLAAPGRVVPAAPLEAPSLGLLRRPDLAVLPAPVARPLLVVEVVAPHFLEFDHRTRARDYAAMGIPTYLLVDPRTGTGIVHDEPNYTCRTDFAFGDVITVGPWTLDTGVLRTYSG